MSTWLLICTVVCIVLVLTLLFTPIRIAVNSDEATAGIGFGRWIEAGLRAGDGWVAYARFFFLHRQWNLTELPQKRRAPKKKRRKTAHRKWQLQKMAALLRSFRVEQCSITYSTGDMPLDAILYPLGFNLARWLHQDISINFAGEQRLVLQLGNNLARLIYTYTRYSLSL